MKKISLIFVFIFLIEIVLVFKKNFINSTYIKSLSSIDNIVSDNNYERVVEIEGSKFLGRQTFSTAELIRNPSKFNHVVTDFLTDAGAFNDVETVDGIINISIDATRVNWYSVFTIDMPGYIEFSRYLKVVYRVDRLNDNRKFIQSAKLCIEAHQYYYNYPNGGYIDNGVKIWSAEVK